jgi:predicted metallopeptidase
MKTIKLVILSIFTVALAYATSLPAVTQATIQSEAQTAITGTWKIERRYDKETKAEKLGEIQLSLERRTEGGRNNHGSNYKISDFEGLSSDQINSTNSTASFRMVREAGTIDFEGVFHNGLGTGTFRFTANPAFVENMRSRGYANISQERLFTATFLNLTMAFIDDLRSAGFGDLGIEELFKARIFNVTPQFMSEMKSIGFPGLGMEDLVKARIFKIDADFARQVKEMGFANDSMEGLVKLRIFKVTPEFLREMRTSNFPNLSSEEAVKLRIFKVTPEFMNELKAEGFANLSVEEAVKFKIFNITTDFIRQAKAEKPNVSVEELVRMKIGVRRHDKNEKWDKDKDKHKDKDIDNDDDDDNDEDEDNDN